MRVINLITVSIICLFVISCNNNKNVPYVIFDTDIGNDIDDVLALQMLLNYESQSAIDIGCITISKCNPNSIDFLDGYCRFNGYDNIPIGYAYNGVTPEDNTYLIPTLKAEYKGEKILNPKRSIKSDIPQAHVLMREKLSQAKDNSVILVAVGPLTNVANLLKSKGDIYSFLDGVNLVKRKVSKICIMSGDFSDKENFTEWNLKMDIDASRTVYENCPVPLIISGFEVGEKVHYPHESILTDFGDPMSHPLSVAYCFYSQMPYDRETWDLTSLYDAVNPINAVFRHSPKGTVTIDDCGITSFRESVDGLHQYLIVDNIPMAVDVLKKQVTWKSRQ